MKKGFKSSTYNFQELEDQRKEEENQENQDNQADQDNQASDETVVDDDEVSVIPYCLTRWRWTPQVYINEFINWILNLLVVSRMQYIMSWLFEYWTC